MIIMLNIQNVIEWSLIGDVASRARHAELSLVNRTDQVVSDIQCPWPTLPVTRHVRLHLSRRSAKRLLEIWLKTG